MNVEEVFNVQDLFFRLIRLSMFVLVEFTIESTKKKKKKDKEKCCKRKLLRKKEI